MSTSTALLSNAALVEAFQASAEFREFALKFQAKASEAMYDLHTVESLGTSLTLPQVAVIYQGVKALPKSLGSTWGEAVSRECLSIIKKAGYKADWSGIQALVSYEPKN